MLLLRFYGLEPAALEALTVVQLEQLCSEAARLNRGPDE